ncbi:MAG: ribonuclease R [Chlamydiota bacterium]
MAKKKDPHLYENLSKVLQQCMKGKRYTPIGQTALFKRLKIQKELHPLCKEIMADLVKEGVLTCDKKRYSLKTHDIETILGTLRLHPKGFGFVIPDNPAQSASDIFIPKHLTESAVDGDKVEVAINPSSNPEKGPEGKIVCITKRGRSHLAGTVRSIDRQKMAFVHVPILGSSKQAIVEKAGDLKVGDRVIMKILEWGDREESTYCEVTQKIGHISDPSTDILAATEEFDLPTSFPKAVINEAKSFGKSVSAKDKKARKDLSELECFTIDPETAKDFDDALSIRKTNKGHYQLGVHIADVAHYVKQDSALDIEAFKRANSTYFPGTCIPMLPEELSNNLCSLRSGVFRLTSSVLMEFDPSGSLLKYKIVRSYIKSKKRFSYEEAKDVIDGKTKSVHAPSLKLMVELCLLLKKQRYARGSVDFSLPDLVLEVDKKGEPKGVKWVEYDISHQLVEEFMLKANEIVALDLSNRGKELLFRTHEPPTAENFEDFFNLARSFGFIVPDKPTSQEIQHLFEQAKKTPYIKQLSIGFIRSMKLAYYSKENVGHFGLSLEHYTHFTSPIRRYCDLIIHRLLFDEESEDIDLKQIALKCSEQERVSFRAEMSVKLLKKLRLLSRYFKEDPTREYSAILSKVKPFGLFFELSELMLEGFLHISELEDDYFVFDSRRGVLVGKDTSKIHSNGDKISVRIVSIDLILLESKWELVFSQKKKKPRRK